MAKSTQWREVQLLDASSASAPFPAQVLPHSFEDIGSTEPRKQDFRLKQPAQFVSDLRRFSCAMLQCPAAPAQAISRVLRLSPQVFHTLRRESAPSEGSAPIENTSALAPSLTAAGLAPSYKQQGILKERLQLRRAGEALSWTPHHSLCGIQHAEPPEDSPDALAASIVEATAALEELSKSCFAACCEEAGVSAKDMLSQIGDHGYTPSASSKGKGKSVLNLYHYFNDDECDEEPCREHADPGLLTLLCRSTNAALQVRIPQRDSNTSVESRGYEPVWRDVEAAMDLAATHEMKEVAEQPGLVLLVIVGETLERLTQGRLSACQHRVVKVAGDRLNLAYEMRPRVNVWHPWEAAATPCEGG